MYVDSPLAIEATNVFNKNVKGCFDEDAMALVNQGINPLLFQGLKTTIDVYKRQRLQIWRHPENYEKGYQTLQGLYAIGSGGLFGKGFGSSIQKLGFVPEAQNDMIFSIICEELGLVGASFVLLLFLILIWRFFVIASHAPDLELSLIHI